MFQITARNISNLAQVSDYEVEVSVVGEWGVEPLWRGRVEGHNQLDGWWTLVEKIAKAVQAPNE